MMKHTTILLLLAALLCQAPAIAQRDRVSRPVRPGVAISYPNQKLAPSPSAKPRQETAPTKKTKRAVVDDIDWEQEKSHTIALTWDAESRSLVLDGNRYAMVLVRGDSAGDFLIGQTEVPQWLWNCFCDNRSSWQSDPNLPVDNADAEACEQFLRRLNRQTGLRFALPSARQWQYAAAGGELSEGHTYCGADKIHPVAWYALNSGSKTHPVGSKQPNELGLYDMSGNVWERCQGNVYCGGGWNSNPSMCTPCSQSDSTNNDCFNHIGLRIILQQQ